jgi:hypothetical protein
MSGRRFNYDAGIHPMNQPITAASQIGCPIRSVLPRP